MSAESTLQQSTGAPGESNGRPAVEWMTLAMSTAIVLGMLAAISWMYFRGDELPAAIVAVPSLDDVRERDGQWYLPVEIRNDGDITVSGATVEGELDTGEGQPQRAQVMIDYLAGGERERATLIFSSDPRSGDLTVGPTSYQDP